MMLVVAARPRSSSALRNCARLSSAFLMPASEVGPLMPGVTVLRLSPCIVLAAVGIARPEHQHERLVARLEHRQHDLGGDVGEIGLLRDIRHRGARRLGVAGLAVVAARRRRQRQDWPWSARPSSRPRAGTPVLPPVESSITIECRLCRSVGMVENQGRAELADRRRAEALARAPSSAGSLRSDSRRRNARRHRRAPESFSRKGTTVSPAGADGIAGIDRVAEDRRCRRDNGRSPSPRRWPW